MVFLLGSMLDNATILLRGSHDLAGLETYRAPRLFDVDVLACLAGPDRLQSMVVWFGVAMEIASMDFVFEQLAQIGVAGGAFSLFAFSISPNRALRMDSSISQMAAISTFGIPL